MCVQSMCGWDSVWMGTMDREINAGKLSAELNKRGCDGCKKRNLFSNMQPIHDKSQTQSV